MGNEWNQLFDDIIGNEEGYFLGSYICVSTRTMGTPELELIDGQQRFTTISILLATIYSRLNKNREKLEEDEISTLINIKKELTYNVEKGIYKPKLLLQVQNSNLDDYLSLLYENEIISDKIKKPNNAGNRRIYKAFKYFNKCIDEYINENLNENNNEISLLLDLKDKFNEAIIVGIEVDSHKDAYMLFESLNNRGIPLSAVDLIKNTPISSSESSNKSDECYEEWKTALGYLTDEYSTQERFFRQYYNAFREDGRYDVICSGSLMGINYKEIESNSVGNKEDYIMNSFDFEEFLWAKGYTDEQINDLYKCMIELKPLSDIQYNVMMSNFKEYMIVGGMPAIVNQFVTNKNFSGILI